MKFSLLVLYSSLFLSSLSSQTEFTLSGFIKDGSSGETMIGATAFVESLGVGTTSNEYGFYSLSLPTGEYKVEFSFLGFNTIFKSFSLTENIKFDIELSEEVLNLDAVVVSSESEDKNVSDVEMSVNKLDIGTIKRMPALLGEVEIIRSLQLLPGVSSVGEGASGFNVRGGSIDQNLVLLDEAPVYNSSHLFGFFSVFNPDAVKDVKLYKGGIPPRYGGRISSILDVRMKEGNNKKFTMDGGIGVIFSRLSIEGPIVKEKASFIVAARRSYIDVLSKPFLSGDLDDSVLNFYDLTLKTNYNINDRNRIYLSGYFGRDNFGFGSSAGFNWGNSTGTVRWNHLFSDKLFSNITLYYSDYDYELHFGDEAINQFDWNANIVNYSLKPELSYFINPNSVLKFGGQIIGYEFEPGNAIGISEGEVSDVSLPKKYAIEGGLYVENEMDFSEKISMNYGLRLSYFNYAGEGYAYEYGESLFEARRRPVTSSKYFKQWESIKQFLYLEPRFSMKLQVGPSSSVKASYMRTVQYIHLVSNTTASTPVDVWTPSTNNIDPQLGDQFAVGYFRNLDNNKYEFSAEAFYKKMQNQIDYIEGADLLLNQFLEGDLIEGEGRAYGLELLFKKNSRKFSGWISYTLSKSERLVPGINNNGWYPARFDQAHNLSITSFVELNSRWSLGANFVFNTGTPTTFPNSRFGQQGYVVPHNLSDSRNNVRIPNYHRLDISATLAPKQDDKKWKGEWIFSIYNVYSRKNPFSIYFRQQQERALPGNPISTEAIQLSVIGNFIPAVSYNFKLN